MEVEDVNLVDETLKNDLFIKNTLDNNLQEQNGNFIAGKSPVSNNTLLNGTSASVMDLETNSMEVDEILEESDLAGIEVSEATMQDEATTEPEHMELDDDVLEQTTEHTKPETTINCGLSDDIFLTSDESLDKTEVTENATTTTTNGVVSLQVEEIAPENYAQFKQCEEETTQSIVELADGDQTVVNEDTSYSGGFKIMDISNKCENSVSEEINVGENLDKLEAALNEISADDAIVVEADEEEEEASNFLDKPNDVFPIEAEKAQEVEKEKTTLPEIEENIEEAISKDLESTNETSVINISDEMETEKCEEQNNQLETVENVEEESSKKLLDVEMSQESETAKEEPKIADKELMSDDDVSIVESNVKDIIVEIDDDSNDKMEVQKDTESEKANEQKEEQEQQLVTNNDKPSGNVIEIDDDDSMSKNQNEQANGADLPVVNSLEKPALIEETVMPMEVAVTEDTQKVQISEIFENKECINHECTRKNTEYYRASMFVLNAFSVNKRKKMQFVCGECWEIAVRRYEGYAALLGAGKCLYDLQLKTSVSDCVEVIDSSDEEDNENGQEHTTEPTLPMKVLNFIETDLDSCLASVFEKVNFQQQMSHCLTSFRNRIKTLSNTNRTIHIELKSMQKNTDKIQHALNQLPKQKSHSLPSLNISEVLPIPNLPPVGEVERPPIVVDQMYFAVKSKPIARWVACTVVQLMDSSKQFYRVRYIRSSYQNCKIVTAKHLAYYHPPEVRLPIGTRVIAYFDGTLLQRSNKDNISVAQSAFYPGIIAEPLRSTNNYRYLIFYDDGYTQYVKHDDVRLVCSVSENVWEDVHPGSREFIQKYLMQYAINRPMVQTQKGHHMQTESDGKWLHARVLDIDCSLVQMLFEGPKTHTEWIYRGSARLGPVFREFQKTSKPPNVVSRLPRRTEPFIRYTADEETTMQQQQEQQKAQQQKQQQQQQQQQQNRCVPQQRPATAKKSVSRPDMSQQLQSQKPQQQQSQYQQQQQKNTQLTNQQQPVRHLNNSTIYVEDDTIPQGKVVYYMARRNLPPKKYRPHHCDPQCLFKVLHNLNSYSPLSKPLLSGWERMIMKQKNKRSVVYRGPCGKVMRNFKEVHDYLRLTNCSWNVDNFDFSTEISCLAEYLVENSVVHKRDISGGQEKMPISLVNCYDNTLPPACEYSAQRIPTEGVNLNLDEEFLVGCDCEDDCVDKSKCSCWGLTLAGAKYGNANTPADEVGYQYKRLFEHVPTGIYECNSRCKCKSSCMNRVVQLSLQMKLQVFKTSNRGWGLRCLHDIPRGSFICIYAGHLLTEAKANEGGIDAGDEYFAELDYIEVAEQIKEGYESEPESMDNEESEEESYIPDADDDVEFTPGKPHRKNLKRSKAADEDNMERAVRNFNPNAEMNDNSGRESSMRKLFGKDEACYIMDAKITGNLGRYFNHSCAPNLFVQNVFVDTHDLRFPWVAFFASSDIRAGTELTWNYNYEVGVVPGKVLYCQCGAPNCRVRLL